MPKKIVAAAVAALALAAAGVAAAVAVAKPQSFQSLAASRARGTVSLHQTKLGKVLATMSGKTLYLFMADRHGRSACYGQCATYWPPLLAAHKPTAGAGVKAKLLGTVRRKNGTRQVTYRGHPLYRFKLDRKPGQTAGEGQAFFGGKWWRLRGGQGGQEGASTGDGDHVVDHDHHQPVHHDQPLLNCAVHRRRAVSVRRRWTSTSTRARISSGA
jgi:predicted lipoprotein with Yx(FWY)xxD motif